MFSLSLSLTLPLTLSRSLFQEHNEAMASLTAELESERTENEMRVKDLEEAISELKVRTCLRA